MNSRKLFIGCGIVVALGLGIVLIGIIASYLFPKQLPPGATSILVNINLPLNGSELPLNEPVSIYAEAVSGSTVHDLELWLDGAFSPIKMDTSPADQPTITATWLWTPAEEGVHRLIVRAIGPDGEVVNSNVVRVSVLSRDKISDLQVTPIPPDQLPPLAAPAEGVAFQPPDGISPTPEPPPFPLEDQPQVPASPAGAPGLQGSINLCDAALLIQDNAGDEKGFYIYRLDPTSADFARVATLDKYPDTGSFTYIDPGLSLGNHTYYIASFNGTGETPSNLINLKVTEAQCAASNPQAFGLQDAMLTTNKAVDKIYCYLSVDQGPWTRIPYGSNKFIYASATGFDLGKYLNNLISPPPPGGVTLELECWGWSGGTLEYLGYLKQDVGKGPVQLIGKDFVLAALGTDYTIFEFPPPPPPPPAPNIAPPRSLNITRDYNKCVSLISEIYVQSTAANECKNSLGYGYTYLSWHWSPNCWIPSPTCPYTVKDIDGYRVYRVYPGGKPEQVFLTANGDTHTWAFLAPTTTGLMVQPEYFVRAYKGDQESIDSQHIMGLSPQYTKTFTPSKLWVTSVERYKIEGEDEKQEINDIVVNNAFWVGYDYHSGEDISKWWYSSYNDVHVAFNMSEINGSVTGATLRWTRKSANAHGGGLADGYPLGCWIPLVDQYGAIIANYPLPKDGGIDVTTQVRAWKQGTGIIKSGFVFLSGDTQLALVENEVCMLQLGDFELEVTTDKP